MRKAVLADALCWYNAAALKSDSIRRLMADQTQDPEIPRRICPTCGTRVRADASRCVVCGSELRPVKAISPPRARGGTRLVTLPLPIALVALVAIVALSAGLTYAAGRLTGPAVQREPTSTSTATLSSSNTPEPTATDTPAPTWTPLPPIQITLPPNFYCVDLAARFDVSLQSILDLNPGMQCELLTVGQPILIPQPTLTATALPTETLMPEEATAAACEKVMYTVQANDTLSGIAENYNVSMQAIMDFNGMSGPTVFAAQVLIIPLCERNPTPGASPTPTPPPPYPGPNLLLPLDGEAFTLANDTVTLQWASVAQLRENEFYQVTAEDITEGSGTRRLVAYITDTKYIVPVSLRPAESLPHIIRWWVTTVRQTGANAGGQPIYSSAGATSVRRDFSWSGAALGPSSTP